MKGLGSRKIVCAILGLGIFVIFGVVGSGAAGEGTTTTVKLHIPVIRQTLSPFSLPKKGVSTRRKG
jgi:hypothetical protein